VISENEYMDEDKTHIHTYVSELCTYFERKLKRMRTLKTKLKEKKSKSPQPKAKQCEY
jgi:hypothetical protein